MNVLEDRSPVLPTMDFVPFVRLTSSSRAVAACRNVSGVRIERFQWPGMPGAPQNSVHLSDTVCSITPLEPEWFGLDVRVRRIPAKSPRPISKAGVCGEAFLT